MRIQTLGDTVPTYEEMVDANLDNDGFYNDLNNPVQSSWFDNLLNAGTTIATTALGPNSATANLTQAQRNALLAQQRANGQSPMSTQTMLLIGAAVLGLVLILKKR